MPDALDVAAVVSLVVVNTIALTLLVWWVTLAYNMVYKGHYETLSLIPLCYVTYVLGKEAICLRPARRLPHCMSLIKHTGCILISQS